jgi:hypothetical protein
MEASTNEGAVTPVDVATLCEWLHIQPDDICFAFVYLAKLRSSSLSLVCSPLRLIAGMARASMAPHGLTQVRYHLLLLLFCFFYCFLYHFSYALLCALDWDVYVILEDYAGPLARPDIPDAGIAKSTPTPLVRTHHG